MDFVNLTGTIFSCYRLFSNFILMFFLFCFFRKAISSQRRRFFSLSMAAKHAIHGCGWTIWKSFHLFSLWNLWM